LFSGIWADSSRTALRCGAIRTGAGGAFGRQSIKKQIQNFETFDTAQQNWGKLIEAHQATVKPISDACIDVAEDIRPEMRPKFKRSFLAYCGLKGQEIEPYDGATAEYLEKHAVISVLPNYAKGVSIITGHLHALIECAR
jgi:hypothetical protein